MEEEEEREQPWQAAAGGKVNVPFLSCALCVCVCVLDACECLCCVVQGNASGDAS